MKHGRSLAARVIVAVAAGAALGAWVGQSPVILGVGTEELGRLGMLVIRALKALAVPLVFVTIVDAIVSYEVGRGMLGRLAGACLVNACVALALGLLLVNGLEPGRRLEAHFRDVVASLPAGATPGLPVSTDVLSSIEAMVPKSTLDPFVQGSVLPVVLLAVLAGMALRHVRTRPRPEGDRVDEHGTGLVKTALEALMQALSWIVLAVPVAAFGLVAHAVGKSGLALLVDLWPVVTVIVAAMALQTLGWYPIVAWLAGGRTPRAFLGSSREAVLTGVATNSSLATVPQTLRCLDRLGVRPESARLAACAGTNLNNDGITLYEVMAALIVAQACGMDLDLGAQAVLAGAALMAGVGMAGIPEAGLIVLPVVLSAAGFSEAVIAVAVPLMFPIDWILARCRTVVNVMGDMVVATAVDGRAGVEGCEARPPKRKGPGAVPALG